MARLQEKYKDVVSPALQSELGISNVLAVPRLVKIVISMGMGRASANRQLLDAAAAELALIAGQKPLVCNARKSVSNFKLREGMAIGLKVTLRGPRMYEFLDRLISVALPRVRDFRGLSPKGFDSRGNYNMGISEQTVFPEVPADKVQFQQGMNITMVTTTKSDAHSFALLQKLGMPFRDTK
ncbi:MAG: 50S ribosomal protein L5 [Phycisphaerae bacterium]|jgi:large subunit ribosomal protein L5|nr:50S ribosomal protein L5 [Phycisphaerae bacterium]